MVFVILLRDQDVAKGYLAYFWHFLSIQFRHVYKEEIFVADAITKLDQGVYSIAIWFNCLPLSLSRAFYLNQLGRNYCDFIL